MPLAGSTKVHHRYVIFRKAGGKELSYIDEGEVDKRFIFLPVYPRSFPTLQSRDDPFIHFIATGPDTGPQGGKEGCPFRAKCPSHGLYRFHGDLPRRASPSRMHGTYGRPFRVAEEDGNAVGGFYGQGQPLWSVMTASASGIVEALSSTLMTL